MTPGSHPAGHCNLWLLVPERHSTMASSRSERSLSGFLKTDQHTLPTKSGSATVTGEVYTRADGKKVRRVAASELGSFLDGGAPARGTNKKGSSATVAGSAPTDGEVYINAEGKKVRRVLRKKKSADDLGSFLDHASSSPKKKKMSGSASVGPGLVATSHTTSEVYINAEGKKVRRVLKKKDTATDSSSLSGFLSSSASASKPTKSGSATVSGGAPARDGEVYINAEGKKVRRVVRKVTSSATVASGGSGGSNDNKTKSSSLGGFLDQGAVAKPKRSGSATVTGSTPSKSFTEGEIYIRPDGKKVRRIRKSTVTPSDNDTKTSSLGGFLDQGAVAKPKRSGSATVTGSSPSKSADGEIYIRPDGKKVIRRKKESLGGFLDATAVAKPKRSGSATVGGGAPARDGEIYINKDGKKVRRVRKVPAAATNNGTSSSAAALGSFLDTTKASGPKKGSSATVAGSKPTTEGEIYIRADGKKVRRVRKSSASSVSPSATPKLGGFLDSNAAASAKPGMSGAATVSGDRVIKTTENGDEIIIRDGKKILRRKKKPAATATNGQEGEVYRRADGKLVRRVKKSAAGDLAGFMDKEQKKSPARPLGSGATVSGAADGSGRKIDIAELKLPGSRPTTPQTAPLSDSGHSPKPISPSKNGKTGMASLDPNEFTIASQYKILLQQGTSPTKVRQQMERDSIDPKIMDVVLAVPGASPQRGARAIGSVDGMPVAPSIGGDSPGLAPEEEEVAKAYRKMLKMGLPEDAVKHKMTQDGVDARIIANVLGKPIEAASEPENDSAAMNASAIELSGAEEEIAASYRKMLKMGLPDDAVRHKMIQDGIDEKIRASVLGLPAPASAQSSAPAAQPQAPAPASDLSAEEETVAESYRKMLKMGLPEDAVKHKMTQDGVDQRVIAVVLGLPVPPRATSAGESSSAVVLTDAEETIAASYRKMLKMGLPPDSVKHKMTQDGVDQKIATAVLEGPPAESATRASPTASAGSSLPALSSEEKAIVESYQKMLKMGLPKDAVKHKMVQDGVDAKLIPYAMDNDPPPPKAPAREEHPHGIKAKNAVAYIVVVSDDADNSLSSKLNGVGGKSDKDSDADTRSIDSKSTVDPSEKFAVKVDGTDDEASKAAKTQASTKYMTLEELAKISGQSKSALEAIVTEKRKRASSPPRFVLQPMEKQMPENLYQVQVPDKPAPSAPAPAAAAPAAAPAATAAAAASSQQVPPAPPGSKLKAIKEGHEVVDSELAKAARAVSALGDLDMKSLLAKLQTGDLGALLAKLEDAEKRQRKLEKQLAQAGVAIAEDIDYGEAKVKVEQIAKRMNEIGGSDVEVADKEEQTRLREEYFKLEQEMERYNTALMLTEEYQAEIERQEREWEESNRADNEEALRKIRRHMPVKIRHMSEAELTNTPTPNGKFLPKAIAKKFKRTNVLQCLRLNPDDLERMHPSTLENMRVTGMTLTERRAVYCHLQSLGPKWEKNKAEKMTERKWTWYQMMKNNFKENLAPYKRHVDQYGPPHNHVGCPLLGKQCPIKADLMVDYNGDYGYTPEAEFEVSEVRKSDADDPGAKAMQEALELAREKKANERADLLKKHYKGKLLQVSKANGSCESMDEAMDKMEFNSEAWIMGKLEKKGKETEADHKKELGRITEALNELKLSVLDFAQRSGMQMSGKKKAGGDSEDIRSAVECSLAEEVWEASKEFFTYITTRLKEVGIRDTRVEKTIELLQNMLGELHERNIATLQRLGVERSERSRELKTNASMTKIAQAKIKAAEEKEAAESAEAAGAAGPPMGGGGRGGLLGDIAGRGRGGRGGLLDAIAGGRGRGRGGRGGGGRGGLLDAIAGARGGGRGGRGGGDDGGRGGLMAAIAARGSGGEGRGGGDGGRGGLMAAIAARGAGRGRGGGGDGGRGGLMAAIAARGGGGG